MGSQNIGVPMFFDGGLRKTSVKPMFFDGRLSETSADLHVEAGTCRKVEKRGRSMGG